MACLLFDEDIVTDRTQKERKEQNKYIGTVKKNKLTKTRRYLKYLNDFILFGDSY